MTAGASAILVAVGGGAAGVAALVHDEPRIVTAVGQGAVARHPATPSPPDGIDAVPRQNLRPADPQAPAGQAEPARRKPREDPAGQAVDPLSDPLTDPVQRRARDGADRTGTRPPPRQATAAAPVVTTRTETEVRDVPYRTRLVRDPGLARGAREVREPGAPGEETLRWQVTYTDGRETDRRLLDSVVTREPQHRVVAFGARGHRGGHRECRPGRRHCFPIGRTENCSTGGRDFVLLSEREVVRLDLKPELVC